MVDWSMFSVQVKRMSIRILSKQWIKHSNGNGMSPWEIDRKNHCCQAPFMIPITISMTTHQMTLNRMEIAMQSTQADGAFMVMVLLHCQQQQQQCNRCKPAKNQFQLKITWTIHHQTITRLPSNGIQTTSMTLHGHIVWTTINGNSNRTPSNTAQIQHLKPIYQWRCDAKRIVSVVLLVNPIR